MKSTLFPSARNQSQSGRALNVTPQTPGFAEEHRGMMPQDINMGQAFLSGTLAAQELNTRTDKWVAQNKENKAMLHSKGSYCQSEEASCGT